MKKSCLSFLVFTVTLSSFLLSQTGNLSGVISSDGQGLPGANVVLEGTSLGAAADAEGKYTVSNVQPGEYTVTVTYVGYNASSQMVQVSSGETVQLDFQLTLAPVAMDEVVVTAYGTAKRVEFTGAASVTTAEDLQRVVATNIANALEGNVSGVQVVTADGTPGSNPTIRIRGISSINGVSDPLYVVNGAPFGGDLNSLDINDVESVTVLKDASATAIYGSRAAAGVIVITTKKGKPGKPKFTFKKTSGTSTPATGLHKRVNNAQTYEMRWEAIKNGYLDGNPTATVAQGEQFAHDNVLSVLGGYNSFDRYPLLPNGKMNPEAVSRWDPGPTNWEDAIINPGPRDEYHLSVSGETTDGINYMLSGGYLNDAGYLTHQNFDRYTARIDVSTKVNEKIDIGLNASMSRSEFEGPHWVRHQYGFVLDTPDIYPVYQWDDATKDWKKGDDNGKLYDLGGGNSDSYNNLARGSWANVHPLQQADDNITKDERTNVSTRGYVGFSPIEGLTLKSSLSVDYAGSTHKNYWTTERGLLKGGGLLQRRNSTNFVYTFNNLATYTGSFGDHNVNVMGGYEAYALQFRDVSSQGNGFAVPTLTELGAAGSITAGWSNEDNHRIASYLSRVQYNFQEKYFFSGSFRKDGTSRFSETSRWGNFSSVGVSWRMSKEKFMANYSDWLNDLTVRVSSGTQGNERIGSYYAALGTYSISSNLGATALQLNTISNDILKWENNVQTNFGFTAGLFGRVNVNFDYFVKKSQGLLFHRELPISAGLAGVNENIGDVENRGYELEVLANMFPAGNEIQWQTKFNVSAFKNEITRLPAEEIAAGWFRYKVGVSAYEFYLREWRGVNPANGHALWTMDNTTTEDINQATFDWRGSALPDAYGNIMNTFGYKSWDLSVNVTWQLGGQIYDNRYQRLSHAGSRNKAETFAAESYDYWTPENTDAYHPRLTTYGAIGNMYHQNSTRFLVKGTHARVRNITLGYTLPNSVSSGFGIPMARVYLQMENFMTFFHKSDRNLDPEARLNGATAVGGGSAPTPTKTFNFGLTITL